jgi:hypothetical protein
MLTATETENLGFSTKPIGKAICVDCPRCEVIAGEKCVNVSEASEDQIFPAQISSAPHKERGQLARWVEMLHI